MRQLILKVQSFLILLVLVSANVQAQKSPVDMDRFIDDLMKKMTLEEKIGQMFLVDVDKLLKGGRAVTASSPELLQAIERYKVGGIMLGRGNVQSTDQVKSLINDIQQATGENGNLTISLYIGTEAAIDFSPPPSSSVPI